MERIARTMLLAMLLVQGAAIAGQGREVAYKDIARAELMLGKVDTDHVFDTEFRVKPAREGASLPPDLRVEVVVSGKTVPIRFDPDGKLYLPARQDWLDAGAKVRLNHPKDEVLLTYTYTARTPPGIRMSYSRLTESLQVMERGIEREAGLLRFMAPKPYALGMVFEPGAVQEVTLRFADGSRKSFRSVTKTAIKGASNSLELPWNPRWNDVEVELSAPAKGVLPLVK